MEDRKFRRSLLHTRDVKDISVLGLNENGYDNINNDDISLFALPSTGKITMNDVRTELKLNGRIGLGQTEVRNLAKIPSGRISLNDLKGKSDESVPDPKDCDYYFETREDFDKRIDKIIQDNNSDLSQKTFGFSDSVTNLSQAFAMLYNIQIAITKTPKMIVAKNATTCKEIFSTAYGATVDVTDKLFFGCPNVKDFSYAFTSIHGGGANNIPATLFSKNIEAIDFSYCFGNEYNYITAIPEGLFDNCKKAQNFECCFQYLLKIVTVPQNLFDNCIEATNFKYCFEGLSETKSVLPDVWNKDKFPKVTYGIGYAKYCTNAANYNEIPADFK